jgi:hypothetical protein
MMPSRFAPILLSFGLALVLACGGKQKPAPEAPPANAPVAEPATTPPPAEPATPPTAASGERPATVTDEMVAVADEMVVAMENMGKELTAAGTDCAKGAAGIRNGMTAMKPIAKRAKAFSNQDDPAAEEWFKTTYMPRMMNAMQGLMSLAQTCSSDKDFNAALQEMGQMDM